MARERQLTLLDRKKKIETLLPLVDHSRARGLIRELRQINNALGLPTPEPITREELDKDGVVASASGVNGLGGLWFEAQTPPGEGRLIRLPFYLTRIDSVSPADIVTAAGAGLPSLTSPVVIAAVPFGQRAISGMFFETPVIEWAKLRIVGFEAAATPFMPQGLDPHLRVITVQRPFLLVKELQLGRGANLFSQEGYIDAALHDAKIPEFPGLRAYPLLESPNNCSVQAAVSGFADAVNKIQASMVFSLSLLCEVLDDSEHGMHVPGPYARRNAMLRDPHPDGGFARK